MTALVFAGLLGSSAFAAAFTFGFRHGFDWDHIAALTDFTGSQRRPRRSMALATGYAVGHAAAVLALGTIAILFARQVPESLDSAMGRVVGVTLLALAAYLVWTVVRHRGAAPVRSRGVLVLRAAQRARQRLRRDRTVVVEHAHPHDHGSDPAHAHGHADAGPGDDEAPAAVSVRHGHLHRHVGVLPEDPFEGPGLRAAVAVGVIHGIGAETPTQVLIFAAAANADGKATSVALLLCFLAGLVLANTLVALASTYGFRGIAGNRWLMAGLSLLAAGFSAVLGALLVLDRGDALPSLLGV